MVASGRVADGVRRALARAGIGPRSVALTPRQDVLSLGGREATLARIAASALGMLVATALITLALRHEARAYGLDALAVFTTLTVLFVQVSLAALLGYELAFGGAAHADPIAVIVEARRDGRVNTWEWQPSRTAASPGERRNGTEQAT